MSIKPLLGAFWMIQLCAQLQAKTDFIDLKALQNAIVQNHSLVDASKATVQSAIKAAQFADAKPNPKLEIGYWLNPVETRVGSMSSRVGISQSLVPKSRLELKKKIEFDEVAIGEIQANTLIQDLQFQVAIKFFEYEFLHQKLRILEENLKIVDSWTKLWKTHYSHHDFRYQRLVQLQIEATEIQDQIRETQESIPIVFSELSAIAWINSNPVLKPKPLSELKSFELKQDFTHNTSIQLLQAKLAKQENRTQLEKTFFIPNKSIRSDWTNIDSNMNNSGKDAWMLGIGFELLLNKSQVQSNVDSQNKKELAIQAQLTHLKRKLETEFKSNQFQLSNAQKKYQLYKKELIPRTQESLESLQINYISQNKGMDFFALLDTLRKLLSLNLKIEAFKRDYYQALAKQFRLIGKESPW